MTLHPIGSNPICALDDAGAPTPFVTATDADSGRTYLVLLQPYKIGATRVPHIRAIPIGMAPICAISNNAGQAGLVELYYSDTGYTSPALGVNQSIWFEGRVTQPLRMSWALPVVPEGDRRVTLEVSSLELINADGAMDTLVDSYDIAGRSVSVLFGLRDYAFGDFQTIWTGAAVSWARDFASLTITARDNGYVLDIPLQTAFYGGTGGADGTSSLANQPKPLAFGKCRNITPQAIDTTNLVYQFHTRQVQAVDAVYDKGVSLTPGADYASYAALIAASVAGGSYATCLAQGMFRLGSTPAGGVTADVRGDAGGAGYVSTTASIAQRVMTDFGGVAPASINAVAFTSFDAAVPGTIGWYQGTDSVINISDAMTAIVGHCSAWWGALPDGRFTMGRVDAPAESAVTEDFQVWDVMDLQIVAPPDGTSPPRFRQRVSYQKNWTVQQPSELAGAVSQADVLTKGQPYNIATAINSNTEADFILAQDPTILESLFDAQADAQTEATRLIGLLGVMRQAVQVNLDCVGHRIPRGCCVAITAPRINGGQRWLARYIGADIDAGNHEHDLTLWG